MTGMPMNANKDTIKDTMKDDALTVTLTDVTEAFPVEGRGESRRSAEHVVLDRITETFAPGAITSVIGESGCGKTTLLRILAGLIAPTSGAVTYTADGQSVVPRVGVVFQEPRLFPWLTVFENVELAVRHDTPAVRKQKVGAVLERVGLAERAAGLPAVLSGGMAQRVGIARALVAEPDLLLLDEPFSALDALTRARLHTEFLGLIGARPMTTVLVTHDVNEAVFLSDHILRLDSGRFTRRHDVERARPRRRGDPLLAALAQSIIDDFFKPQGGTNP